MSVPGADEPVPSRAVDLARRMRLSRRRLLAGLVSLGVPALAAACGQTLVVERVVIRDVPVERTIVQERVVIREVPVERTIVRERVVTRRVTVEPTIVRERPVVVTPAPTVTAPVSAPAPPAPTATAEPPAVTQAPPISLAAGLTAAGTSADRWEDALDRFAALRPDVTVRAEPLAGGREALQSVSLRAVGGDLPDALAGLPGGALAELTTLHALTPMPDAPIGVDDFVAPLAALGRIGDRQFGLPLTGFPTYLYVHLLALERAGIETPGATYDEVLESARKLTDPAAGVHGWGVVADLPELETVAGSAIGRVWSDDRSRSTLDDPAFVGPWQWYADLIHVERVSPPDEAWDGLMNGHQALAAGRIAMTLRSGWVLDALRRDSLGGEHAWGTVPLPSWAGLPRRAPVNADFAAVVASSDEPDAAGELVRFLATEGLDAQGHPGVPGWTPALDTAADRMGVTRAQLLDASEGWRRPAIDVPDSLAVQDVLFPAIHEVVARGQPAAEHAAAASRSLTEIATGAGAG